MIIGTLAACQPWAWSTPRSQWGHRLSGVAYASRITVEHYAAVPSVWRGGSGVMASQPHQR